MNISKGSPESTSFVTGVGLITSNGLWDHNIMSAEWTHNVSYEPGLIMINLRSWDTTSENILESKEFGVNIASDKQNMVASIAGGHKGKEVDKISVLKDLGVKFYKAKKINVLMLKDAVMNIECKLIEHKQLGDHMMFVGEALEVSLNKNSKPIVYHQGKYWKVGSNIIKPPKNVLKKIDELVEKYKK